MPFLKVLHPHTHTPHTHTYIYIYIYVYILENCENSLITSCLENRCNICQDEKLVL